MSYPDVDDLPKDLYDETFTMFNSLVSPWHQWLDPEYDVPATEEFYSTVKTAWWCTSW